MAFDWEQHKRRICHLYLNERKTLEQLRIELARQYPSFCPSISSYRTKLREWGRLRRQAGERHIQNGRLPRPGRSDRPRSRRSHVERTTPSPQIPELVYQDVDSPTSYREAAPGSTPRVASSPSTPASANANSSVPMAFTGSQESAGAVTALHTRALNEAAQDGFKGHGVGNHSLALAQQAFPDQVSWPMPVPSNGNLPAISFMNQAGSASSFSNTTIEMVPVPSRLSVPAPANALVQPRYHSSATPQHNSESRDALQSQISVGDLAPDFLARRVDTNNNTALHNLVGMAQDIESLEPRLRNTQAIRMVNNQGQTFLHVFNPNGLQHINDVQRFLNLCHELGYNFSQKCNEGISGFDVVQTFWPDYEITSTSLSSSGPFILRPISHVQPQTDSSPMSVAPDFFDLDDIFSWGAFDDGRFTLDDNAWNI